MALRARGSAALGAGFPPLGIVFVDTGDDYLGERILTALTVVLLLGGSAWFTGRVRERYGNPPWGRFDGRSRSRLMPRGRRMPVG